ncbi:MAG: hypothetical protein JXD18_03425 [Anaerolineae bacterium]|nr:hypothetical protein [Anaerolineae bacterium]
MPILKDFTVTVDPDELVEAHRPRGKGATPAQKAALEKPVRAALARLPDLVAPAIVYDFFPVQEVVDQKATLATGHVLAIGEHANLLDPAAEVLVAIVTIGPDLDVEVQAGFSSGDSMLALMLDSAGVIALSHVGEQAVALAEERAAERGYGVSPALSPGSLPDWPLSGQKTLCSLLPIADIGVSLNDSYLLIPYKSASVVIGIGADYKHNAVGSMCHVCALKDHCWRRH